MKAPCIARLWPSITFDAACLWHCRIDLARKPRVKIWPFITKRVYNLHGKQVVWLSRMHRKGLEWRDQLQTPGEVPFWKTRNYNRSIGLWFQVGALLFAIASVLMFFAIHNPHLSNWVNWTFFFGSVPFTIAASLQHLQSANASDKPTPLPVKSRQPRIYLIGWQPRSAGWWSSFSQWLGTLAFNISTFNAIHAPGAQLLDTLEIWAPNFEGSILFLVSGYLAYIEVSDKYWSWRPKNLAWQIVFINLLGCIAFMVSAVAPPSPNLDAAYWFLTYADSYTLIGAVCFFFGALLLERESHYAASI